MSHVKQDCKSPGKEQTNFQICTVTLIHIIHMLIYFLMHYFFPYISSFLPCYLDSIISLSTKLENRHLCLKIYDAGSIIHSLIHSLHSINVFQILLGTRNSDKFEDNDAEKGPLSIFFKTLSMFFKNLDLSKFENVIHSRGFSFLISS